MWRRGLCSAPVAPNQPLCHPAGLRRSVAQDNLFGPCRNEAGRSGCLGSWAGVRASEGATIERGVFVSCRNLIRAGESSAYPFITVCLSMSFPGLTSAAPGKPFQPAAQTQNIAAHIGHVICMGSERRKFAIYSQSGAMHCILGEVDWERHNGIHGLRAICAMFLGTLMLSW